MQTIHHKVQTEVLTLPFLSLFVSFCLFLSLSQSSWFFFVYFFFVFLCLSVFFSFFSSPFFVLSFSVSFCVCLSVSVLLSVTVYVCLSIPFVSFFLFIFKNEFKKTLIKKSLIYIKIQLPLGGGVYFVFHLFTAKTQLILLYERAILLLFIFIFITSSLKVIIHASFIQGSPHGKRIN